MNVVTAVPLRRSSPRSAPKAPEAGKEVPEEKRNLGSLIARVFSNAEPIIITAITRETKAKSETQ